MNSPDISQSTPTHKSLDLDEPLFLFCTDCGFLFGEVTGVGVVVARIEGNIFETMKKGGTRAGAGWIGKQPLGVCGLFKWPNAAATLVRRVSSQSRSPQLAWRVLLLENRFV